MSNIKRIQSQVLFKTKNQIVLIFQEAVMLTSLTEAGLKALRLKILFCNFMK